MGKVILTGLQPTGNLHIGNYLGAINPLINLQNNLEADDKAYLFIPDLHTFTVKTDFSKVDSNIHNLIKCYLACGIDPSKFVIFRQSRVSAHSELAWILNCFTYFGELSRMTHFKDKSKKEEDANNPITAGLFTYPVLMAADILLYEAKYIPVGDDQRQHLELARDIAIRMNNIFQDKLDGDLFAVPKTLKEQLEFAKNGDVARVRSLQEPTKKMSKSVNDPKGTISLIDSPDVATKKIMSAVTDNLASINWDFDNQPGVTNLLQILGGFENLDKNQTLNKVKDVTSYGELKKMVAQSIEKFLFKFDERMAKIDDDYIEDILLKGEIEANIKSQETLQRVHLALGLRYKI
jgi:tryptophanyl-tRNA synthetase